MKNLLKLLLSLPIISTIGSTVSCTNLSDKIIGTSTGSAFVNSNTTEFNKIIENLENNIIDGSKLTTQNTLNDVREIAQRYVGTRANVSIIGSAYNKLTQGINIVSIGVYDANDSSVGKNINLRVDGVKLYQPEVTTPVTTTTTPVTTETTPVETNPASTIDEIVRKVFPDLTVSDANWTYESTSSVVVDKIQAGLLSYNIKVAVKEDLKVAATSDYATLVVSIYAINDEQTKVDYIFKANLKPESEQFFNTLQKTYNVSSDSTPEKISATIDGSSYKMNSTTWKNIADDLQSKAGNEFTISTDHPDFTLKNDNNIFDSSAQISLIFDDGRGLQVLVYFTINHIQLNIKKIFGLVAKDIQDDAQSNFFITQSEDEVAKYIESKMVSGALYVTAPYHGTLQLTETRVVNTTVEAKTYIELDFRQKDNEKNHYWASMQFYVYSMN